VSIRVLTYQFNKCVAGFLRASGGWDGRGVDAGVEGAQGGAAVAGAQWGGHRQKLAL
jgi:hypothetical protein